MGKVKTALRATVDFFIGGEFFFFAFLVCGQFKALFKPYLPVDLTLVFMLLCVCCGVYRLVKCKFKLSWPGILRMGIPFAIIIITFFFSMRQPFALSERYGMDKFQDTLFMLGFTVSMPFLLLTSEKSLKRFFASLLVYCGWLATETFLRAITGTIGRIGFIDVLGTSYMQASRYMTAAFVVMFGLYLGYGKQKKTILGMILYMAGMTFGVLAGGARAAVPLLYAFLAYPIVLLLISLVKKRQSTQPIKPVLTKYAVMVGSIGMVSILLFLTPFTNTLKYRFGVLNEQMNSPGFNFSDGDDNIGGSGAPGEQTGQDGQNGQKPSMSDEKKQHEIKKELRLNEDVLNAWYHPRWAQLPSWMRSVGVPTELVGKMQVENWERQRNTQTLISRRDLYLYAFDMIKRRPTTGWGLGSYPVYIMNVDATFYPHNMFLEVWAEAGLYAFLAFCAMIVMALWRSARAWWLTRGEKNNGLYLALFMLLCYLLSLSLFVDFANGLRILFAVMSIAMLAPFNGTQRFWTEEEWMKRRWARGIYKAGRYLWGKPRRALPNAEDQ